MQIRAEVVASFVRELLNKKINPYFAGYLCIKRTSVREGRTTRLRPNFKEFFDTFFRVADAPRKLPYFRPFWDKGEEFADKLPSAWYQPNVAGSYSPSSVRSNQPFWHVVDVKGTRTSAAYSLRQQHWILARQHLAYGDRIPVVPLAVFLYRDYAIEKHGQPSVSDLVKVFRFEFGYDRLQRDRENPEFRHLYFDDSPRRTSTDWFEART